MRRIALTGPISVADYIAACLMHPEHGYYATRDPFGAPGDFTTAPEISQMFGELVGLALAQSWLDQGAPSACTLAELGPGRGTLMADILRATARVPGFHAAARVHLVEGSPVLRAAQARRLADVAPVWHDGAATLPDGPLFVVANEFFDALPVRQFQRIGDRWHERQVGATEGRLRFGQGGPVAAPDPARRLATKDGDVVETRPAAAPVMAALTQRIAMSGGAALIIDYGAWDGVGDTLQAVAGHRRVDPLAAPGEADLTAHVRFADLAAAARDAAEVTVSPLVGQGAFLERLGLDARRHALSATQDGAGRAALDAAYRRLTDPREMGSLFRCLALTPPAARAFPGLTA